MSVGDGGARFDNRPMQQHGIRLPHVAEEVPGGEPHPATSARAEKVTG